MLARVIWYHSSGWLNMTSFLTQVLNARAYVLCTDRLVKSTTGFLMSYKTTLLLKTRGMLTLEYPLTGPRETQVDYHCSSLKGRNFCQPLLFHIFESFFHSLILCDTHKRSKSVFL